MSAQPKKGLGLWMLTALVAGNMIGSGIFLLPASLAHYGTISLISWCFTSVGALFLALVFAQLAQCYPLTGGPYAYCREAYGEFMGFQIAYNYWIALWVGNAAIVTAFVSYTSMFIPQLATYPILGCALGLAILWFLTLVNIVGIRMAGGVQLVTTCLKLMPLIAISLWGLFHAKMQNLSAFNVSGLSSFSAVTGGAALTLWAFVGVESATVPADDVENPKKNIPRATILGTLIAALVYIASTFAVMGALPLEQLQQSNAPYALAASVFFGPIGAKLVTLGAMIASFGALNGWILLQGQIPLAAAQDGLFPKTFSKTTKGHTPYIALIVSGVLMTILLLLTLSNSLVDQFTAIIRLATLATLFPYLLCTMAKILLQLKYPERFIGQRLWPSIILCSLAFIYSFWAIIGSGPETISYGTLLFFSGVPIYVFMRYKSRTL